MKAICDAVGKGLCGMTLCDHYSEHEPQIIEIIDSDHHRKCVSHSLCGSMNIYVQCVYEESITKEQIEIIGTLMYTAHQQIGHDLQTKTGYTSRLGLYELIMDGGWLDELAKKDEEKEAVEKFKNLSFDERRKLMPEVLPSKEYECGKSKFV